MLSRDGLDEQERRVVENIEQFGTHVFQIHGNHGVADEQGIVDDGFSFTIGMQYNFDHPEFIVFGQKTEWQVALLNALREEVRAGVRFEPGSSCESVLPGFTMVFRDVPASAHLEYLGWAVWFYHRIAPQKGPLRVLQAVWPDLAGVLPWEDGYDAGYRQPILDGTHPAIEVNKFGVRASAGVFACSRVMDEGFPVLFVARTVPADDDTGWQFHCGGPHDERGLEARGEAVQWVHLAHLLGRDASLNDAADLEIGWIAERSSLDATWTRRYDLDDGAEEAASS